MNSIHLEKIDENNFLQAFGLKLGEGQDKFVSHPIRSLAQAYVYRDQCTPFGIFCGETMVGYVMVIYDYDLEEYDVWHLMIDKEHQGGKHSTKNKTDGVSHRFFVGDSVQKKRDRIDKCGKDWYNNSP